LSDCETLCINWTCNEPAVAGDYDGEQRSTPCFNTA